MGKHSTSLKMRRRSRQLKKKIREARKVERKVKERRG